MLAVNQYIWLDLGYVRNKLIDCVNKNYNNYDSLYSIKLKHMFNFYGILKSFDYHNKVGLFYLTETFFQNSFPGGSFELFECFGLCMF